jgi:hypothetical protein
MSSSRRTPAEHSVCSLPRLPAKADRENTPPMRRWGNSRVSIFPAPTLRRFAWSALLFAVLFSLRGQTACAQANTAAGLNDLVIMDPGKHERGLPAVFVSYMNDHPEIEIPPTLHVHRYYYSGDKIFQGPIIQGGPTVVVASHPKTGQRMYIDVVLPAGAPRIKYTGNTITYIYNAARRRVEIKFQHFPFRSSVAVVKHHSGKGLGVAVRDKHEKVSEHVKETMQNSQAVNAAKELCIGGGQLAKGAALAVGELTAKSVDAVKQVAGTLPGVPYLTSLAEQAPQRQYEAEIDRASLQNAISETPFVRTNR